MDSIYLNLFVPYSQKDNCNPKENNLSRGFAILLEENCLFFDRIIDLLNFELGKNSYRFIPKPCSLEERSIDIQVYASDLASSFKKDVQRIIPVTLTPELSDEEGEIRDTQNPIPDISIFCTNDENSDLIIIEVKQYQNNADCQVLDQAQKIKDKIQDFDKDFSNSNVLVIENVIRITWQNVISILQDISYLQKGRSDLILEHYLAYLKYYRQCWFPVEPFKSGMNEEMMWKRIWPLANNCARLLNPEEDEISVFENSWSYRVPLKNLLCGYVQEIDLCLSIYEKDNNAIINGIDVKLWPANTIGQSWNLFSNNIKVKNDMSWINENVIPYEDIKLNLRTEFYLKFADSYGGHVMDANLSKDFVGINRAKICEKFCNKLNHRWKKEDWGYLKNYLLIEENGILKNPDKFREDFDVNIDKSRQTVINVSLGYAVTIHLPINLLSNLDKSNANFMDKPEYDAVANLIVSVMKSLRNLIEN